MPNEPDRLFIGVFPAGISYADRSREAHGDYARVAFLSYATLVLEVARDAPPALVERARAHAATVQARKGQRFTVSACGQTVMLGPDDSK